MTECPCSARPTSGDQKIFMKSPGSASAKLSKFWPMSSLVEEARGPRAVRVPSSPDAFSVALAANHQAFECCVIELKRAPRPQSFDCLHENEVGRARAIARRGGIRQNEKFSGFEMRRRLQAYRRHARCGIAPAGRHLLNLLKIKSLNLPGAIWAELNSLAPKEQRQGADDFREIIFQNDATQIKRESSCSNQGAVIFNRRLCFGGFKTPLLLAELALPSDCGNKPPCFGSRR